MTNPIKQVNNEFYRKTKLVPISTLRAGDVLLCFKNEKIDPAGKLITNVTDSEYTHAAICIDPYTAAESLVAKGVRKTEIHGLIQRYDHVAVFRQPDAWSSERIQVLNAFIDSILSSGAKYNLLGVMAFPKKNNIHQLSLDEQLQAYFNGESKPLPIEKGSYFCSELVVYCFIATGFIQSSAAVVYNPSVTSPGALGRDSTFGTFYGYVSVKPDYAIPEFDEFICASTYKEVFGNDA